jgi:hypothetical protein
MSTVIQGYVEPGYLVIKAPEIISPKEVAKAKGETEIFLSASDKKTIARDRANKLKEALEEELSEPIIVLAHTPVNGKPDKTGCRVISMSEVTGEDLMLPALVDGKEVELHCIIMHESNVVFTFNK